MNLITLYVQVLFRLASVYHIMCNLLLVNISQFPQCSLLVQGALGIQDHILVGAYRRANMKT